jgi:riboflavin kinase/FMN adenylyltransferase
VKVIYGLEAVDPPLTRSVLSVGNFDGVHRAHRGLLEQAAACAADAGGPLVVLTFEPHPLTIVAPAKAPPRLSLLEEKLRRLADAGAQLTVIARSEPSLLSLDPERFVEDVLVRRFHPTHMVEGPSFGFGRGRKGTPEVLQRLAARFDFRVRIVEPVNVTLEDGRSVMVSSSLIRDLLSRGRTREAALCLGYPYTLIGTVVRGVGRGKTLGFPTANLDIADQLIPGEGVYAGQANVNDRSFPCATSIGPAATFGGTERHVEAHLLGFDSDLYGRTLRVEFDRFLRPQHKFASPQDLIEQLGRDVHAVRTGAAQSNLPVLDTEVPVR